MLPSQSNLKLAALFVLHAGLSAWGIASQLHASKEGQGVAEQISQLLDRQLSGDEIDLGHAKRVGSDLWRILLQSQWGLLCTASLAANCYAGVALATKALFLGTLTATESSQLTEHALKSVALKLPMLVLLCSSSPRYGSVGEWLAWTAVFLWLSMFVRLASLRGDALLSAPATAAASPKAAARHARILLLLAGILAQDVSWIARHWRALAGGGPSYALLWLVDPLHVALDAGFSVAKYAVHTGEHVRAARAEARGEERECWEGHSGVIYHIELLSALSLQALTLLHNVHVWWLHGLQMQLVDGALFLQVRYLMFGLQQRLRGHLSFVRLQDALRHGFPDAAPDRLQADACPICLETMRAGKLLPCSHVVHASCLCAWLQQQSSSCGAPGPRGAPAFSCPLCRADLDIRLAEPQPNSGAGPAQRSASPRRSSPQPSPACGTTTDGGSPPGRRLTRLQARLAAQAEQAGAGGPANPPSSLQRTTRQRRRIDGMLD